MIRVVLAAALLSVAASAQAPEPLPADTAATVAPSPFVHLVVEASAGAVFVQPVGGPAVGPVAPGAGVDLPPGVDVEITLVDDASAWDPRTDRRRITLPTQPDTVSVALTLPLRYRVESLPLGASVSLEQANGTTRELGIAPLTIDLPTETVGALVGRMTGHAEARLDLTVARATPTALLILPTLGGDPDALPVTLLPTERSQRARIWTDLAIGAATLAAGAVAVYYKSEADAIDDAYRNPMNAARGSDALRDEAARLDRRSLVALGLMQAGVGVLAIRFVLR